MLLNLGTIINDVVKHDTDINEPNIQQNTVVDKSSKKYTESWIDLKLDDQINTIFPVVGSDFHDKAFLETAWYKANNLAVEASFVANAVDSFNSVITNVSNNFNSYVKAFRNTNFNEVVSLEILKKVSSYKLYGKLESASFVENKKLIVSCPEGFQGDFLDYIRTLNSIAPELYANTYSYFNEYKSMLSAFLMNQDKRLIQADNKKLYEKLSNERTVYTDRLNKYFDTRQVKSKATLGSVISRFSDVPVIVDELKKLTDVNNNQNSKDLLALVEECHNRLQMIREAINNKEIDKVSGPSAMQISKGAFEFAKYMELVSVFRYRVDQITSAVDVLVESLKKIR